MKIRFECPNCSFSKDVYVVLDKDGLYTIPAKYCPECLNKLGRTIIEYPKVKDKVGEPVLTRPVVQATEENKGT